MDLSQLEYFRIIAETNNISRAAERIHVSQPALSKNMRGLEQELGCQLFDRRGKQIHLNNNGRIVLRYVEDIFRSFGDMKKELTDAIGLGQDQLVIFDQTNSLFLPQLVTGFQKLYPHIKFNLAKSQFTPNADSRPNRNAAYDFVISANAPLPDGSRGVRLFTEEFVIGFPSGHPMAGRKSVTLEELAQENFIRITRLSTLRQTIDEYCSSAGFICHSTIECAEWYSIRELVKRGMGIAFFPRFSWFPLEEETDIFFASISSPRCTRTIVMSWNSDYLSETERRFVEYSQEFFSTYDFIE